MSSRAVSAALISRSSCLRLAASADTAPTLAHEFALAVTHDAAPGMAREVRELIAKSVASIVYFQFGPDLVATSADYVARWLEDLATFRARMTTIHDAAAPLIDAITPALTASAPLELAARHQPYPQPVQVLGHGWVTHHLDMDVVLPHLSPLRVWRARERASVR